MARKPPAKDVVIIGLGWTGSIMAYELADAGLDVIAIERGPWRNAPMFESHPHRQKRCFGISNL
jgi:choline dehydrogenase-like flavoprotein